VAIAITWSEGTLACGFSLESIQPLDRNLTLSCRPESRPGLGDPGRSGEESAPPASQGLQNCSLLRLQQFVKEPLFSAA